MLVYLRVDWKRLKILIFICCVSFKAIFFKKILSLSIQMKILLNLMLNHEETIALSTLANHVINTSLFIWVKNLFLSDIFHFLERKTKLCGNWVIPRDFEITLKNHHVGNRVSHVICRRSLAIKHHEPSKCLHHNTVRWDSKITQRPKVGTRSNKCVFWRAKDSKQH